MTTDTQDTTVIDTTTERDPQKVWRVLKRDEKADAAFIGPVWVEVGEIESAYGYSTDWDSEQTVGELAGAGEYLLICDATSRATTLRLRAETRYERAEEGEDS